MSATTALREVSVGDGKEKAVEMRRIHDDGATPTEKSRTSDEGENDDDETDVFECSRLPYCWVPRQPGCRCSQGHGLSLIHI